mgnify:CR=1 FL=1
MTAERKIMFGNPAWFEPKKVGWGLTPVTWQGWVYTAAWVGVLTIPFTALMLVQQFPEAFAWLVLGIGALCPFAFMPAAEKPGLAVATMAVQPPATPSATRENARHVFPFRQTAPAGDR